MTTLETLQALTDEELIERVAVEIMEWQPVKTLHGHTVLVPPGEYPSDGNKRVPPDYLTDWNHLRQVENAIVELDREEAYHEQLIAVLDIEYGDIEYHRVDRDRIYDQMLQVIGRLMYADQRSRCIAALLAVSAPSTQA